MNILSTVLIPAYLWWAGCDTLKLKHSPTPCIINCLVLGS